MAPVPDPWDDAPPPADEPPPPEQDPPDELPAAADEAAERSVLGAVLLSAQALDDVAIVLRGRDFYQPRHELIWDAALHLHLQGDGVDAVTVCDELTRRGHLHRAGGAPYLHTLISSVPTAANGAYYARIVRDRAVLRRLATAGQRITALGHATTGGDVDDLIAAAEAELAGIDHAPAGGGAVRAGDLVDDWIDDLEQPIRTEDGIDWPWTDLALQARPLTAGQLAVIGARPGIGKSVMLTCLATHTAVRCGIPTLVHSLEMSRQEILTRVIAAEARIQLDAIAAHTLEGPDWDRLARARGRVKDAPLFIDDTPGVGLPELRASVRRHKPRLLVLDYLQLARVDARPGHRREALEELTRGLKLLAKAEQIPVVVAAQLNRGPEQRADKRPTMADLRETGSVENDADLVALLHREDAYDRESARAGEVDVIIAKQRNGPTGTVALGAQLHYARFVDMERWAS